MARMLLFLVGSLVIAGSVAASARPLPQGISAARSCVVLGFNDTPEPIRMTVQERSFTIPPMRRAPVHTTFYRGGGSERIGGAMVPGTTAVAAAPRDTVVIGQVGIAIGEHCRFAIFHPPWEREEAGAFVFTAAEYRAKPPRQ